MKKVLVIVSILAAAAACGGGSVSGGGATSSNGGASLSQPVSGGGQGSKAAGQPSGTTGGTTTLPGDTVPALSGPPVIRQAQLSMTVGNGLFDSKLTQVRTQQNGGVGGRPHAACFGPRVQKEPVLAPQTHEQRLAGCAASAGVPVSLT